MRRYMYHCTSHACECDAMGGATILRSNQAARAKPLPIPPLESAIFLL
jgi:hypothetical protein